MKEMRLDGLGLRLKEEGLAESPAFSTELHGRVMESLGAKGLEAAKDEREDHGRWRIFVKRVVPLAVAAGIGVAAFVVWWPHEAIVPPSHQEKIVYQPILPEELVKPLKEQVAAPTAEAWERGKYGYLDQDARRLAIFVASQLPGVPVAENPDGN